MQVIAQSWHGWLAYALHAPTTVAFWLMVSGIVITWYFYLIKPSIPTAIKRNLSAMGVYKILENKYYAEWFNEQVIARGVRLLGTGLWKGGDTGLIDGLIVNGSARLVGWFGSIARRLQTGYIYHYAFAMILGIMALLTFFVLTVQ